MLARLIHYLIKKFQIHNIISEFQNDERVNRCKRNVYHEGAVFYPMASIENLQQDATAIKIMNNTHVKGELLVWKHGGSITIGSNCYIGPGSRIWSGSDLGIVIGDNVLISHNVTIIDSDSHEIDFAKRAEGFKSMIKNGHPAVNLSVKTAPVVIENNVWISYNVSILKGVKIGKGAIVGAGSVVTKDVPAFSFVAGNPAVIVKKVNNDEV